MKKRLVVVYAWAVLAVLLTGLLCLAPLLDGGFGLGFWQDAIDLAGVAVLGALLSAGLLYLGYMVRSLRSLQVTADQLGADEVVLKQTRASCVHYRSGNPWRFWEAVGGKLFLTSSRLIFRAHAGQPWRYEIVIPLAELAGAEPCRLGGLANGLRVERIDGTTEVFGCGLESVEEWASAITVLGVLGPMVEGRGAARSNGTGTAEVQRPLRAGDDRLREGRPDDPQASRDITRLEESPIALFPAGDRFLLFVYGTLMRGGVRRRLLADQRFLGEARTLPRYGLLDLGAYPGMVRRDSGGVSVSGELYEVAADRLPELDAEEGAPDLFRLEGVAVEGCDRPVFAYLYQRSVEGASPCPGGRWTHRGRDR